jgi:hypothetical protein
MVGCPIAERLLDHGGPREGIARVEVTVYHADDLPADLDVHVHHHEAGIATGVRKAALVRCHALVGVMRPAKVA